MKIQPAHDGHHNAAAADDGGGVLDRKTRVVASVVQRLGGEGAVHILRRVSTQPEAFNLRCRLGDSQFNRRKDPGGSTEADGMAAL